MYLLRDAICKVRGHDLNKNWCHRCHTGFYPDGGHDRYYRMCRQSWFRRRFWGVFRRVICYRKGHIWQPRGQVHICQRCAKRVSQDDMIHLIMTGKADLGY